MASTKLQSSVIPQHAVRNAAANTSTPLFMYLAWHLVHSPLEAPSHYFGALVTAI